MIKRGTINDINIAPGLVGLGNFLPKSPVAAFNLDAIDDLIQTKGFLGFHVKSAINPNRSTTTAGLDPNDNGFQRIFYSVRPIRMVPQNMGLTDTLTRVGLASQGSAVINMSGNYLDGDGDRVHAKTGDLIVMNPTFTEVYDQSVETPFEDSFPLHYPAREVDYLAGASGEFFQGQDFNITTDGHIAWMKGGRRPKTGEVLAIVYTCSPIFVVGRVEHSLRILPSNPQGSGAAPRKARYAPQLLLCSQSSVRSEGPAFNPFALPTVEDWRKYLLPHEL